MRAPDNSDYAKIPYTNSVKWDGYFINKAFKHWISTERLSWMMHVSLAEKKGIISSPNHF